MSDDRRGRTQLFGDWRDGRIYNEDPHVTTGSTFWVDSVTGTDAAYYGWNPEAPVATLDYAVGLCTHDKHDQIMIMPTHTETVAAAAGIVLDVRDVRIVGIGTGDNRPTITFDGGGVDTAVDIDFDAADVTIENVVFVNTEDGALAPIDVNAAYCGMFNCKFVDDGTDVTIDWIDLDANADYFELLDCQHFGTATAGADSFITMADCQSPTIKNLTSDGDFAAANIEMTAAALDVLFENCDLDNLNAIDVNVECFANATGWLVKNSCKIATDAQTTWYNTPGETCSFHCYGVNDDGETGILVAAPSV